jgi:thiamine biosynthesis lipoprotein
MGVANAIINAGGDVYALGGKPNATTDGGTADTGEAPWLVGIQHPRDSGAYLALLQVADKAVVTSGDYQRYIDYGGARYGHILDPRTGRPAQACVSTTVVADDAELADYLSTAVFVLGPQEGLALIAGIDGAEAIIVGADMGVTMSPGLAGEITFPASLAGLHSLDPIEK